MTEDSHIFAINFKTYVNEVAQQQNSANIFFFHEKIYWPSFTRHFFSIICGRKIVCLFKVVQPEIEHSPFFVNLENFFVNLDVLSELGEVFNLVTYYLNERKSF